MLPWGEERQRVLSTRLILHGEYDIWRREELRAALGGLDPGADVVLDMRAVTFMDAGSAALLIALRKRQSAKNPKARVILLHAPVIVVRVLELSGAKDLFEFSLDG